MEENTMTCNFCNGDEAVFWKDSQNNAFIDSAGEMLVTANDRTIRFKVKHCPMCGRRFADERFLNLKKGDDIYYADRDNNQIEHGKIFSVKIGETGVSSFTVDFDCGDFDEFNGGALGVHYFLNEKDAREALNSNCI